MSAPSPADRLALVAADPVLTGHPVVAGLAAAVGELGERLGALEAENAALREEIADLRRQLNRHSGNSGQPPAALAGRSAGAAAHAANAGRRGASRAMRGRPATGRRGATSMRTTGRSHAAVAGRPCPGSMPAPRPAARCTTCPPPPPPLEVTEHRAHAVRCPGCGTRTRAAFPAGVDGPVRFGPRLEALAAYLRYVQHLPTARLRDLLRELHGVALVTAAFAVLDALRDSCRYHLCVRYRQGNSSGSGTGEAECGRASLGGCPDLIAILNRTQYKRVEPQAPRNPRQSEPAKFQQGAPGPMFALRHGACCVGQAIPNRVDSDGCFDTNHPTRHPP